jgi:hypothetical protein
MGFNLGLKGLNYFVSCMYCTYLRSSVSLFKRPNNPTEQSLHICIYLYTLIYVYLPIYEAGLA